MKKYLTITKNVLKYLAVYYGIQFALMSIIIITYKYRNSTLIYEVVMIISDKRYPIASISSIFSLIVYLFMSNNNLDVFSKLRIKTNYKYNHAFILLISIGWAFISYSLLLLSEDVTSDSILINTLNIDKSFLLNMFCSIIFISFFEEILFRGIIITELNRYTDIRKSILLQAAIFALSHGQITQIFYNFFFGIILALIYIWTESLWFSILTHSIYNLLITLAIPLIGKYYINYYKMLGILGVLFLIYSLNIIHKENYNPDKTAQCLTLNSNP